MSMLDVVQTLSYEEARKNNVLGSLVRVSILNNRLMDHLIHPDTIVWPSTILDHELWVSFQNNVDIIHPDILAMIAYAILSMRKESHTYAIRRNESDDLYLDGSTQSIGTRTLWMSGPLCKTVQLYRAHIPNQEHVHNIVLMRAIRSVQKVVNATNTRKDIVGLLEHGYMVKSTTSTLSNQSIALIADAILDNGNPVDKINTLANISYDHYYAYVVCKFKALKVFQYTLDRYPPFGCSS
jgi:hypothetical protein